MKIEVTKSYQNLPAVFVAFIGRGLSQDVTFFYMGSHFSKLQSCALIFSTNFILFSYLNSARHSLVIEVCRALFFSNFLRSYLVNWRTVL